jgi:enamine deaminase RidA (YjgF/YER057c/UK114 family)
MIVPIWWVTSSAPYHDAIQMFPQTMTATVAGKVNEKGELQGSLTIKLPEVPGPVQRTKEQEAAIIESQEAGWLNAAEQVGGAIVFFALLYFAGKRFALWVKNEPNGKASGTSTGMPKKQEPKPTAISTPAKPDKAMASASNRPARPDGAPKDADLDFMEIHYPEDNHVRLEHLILDKGVMNKLRKTAKHMKTINEAWKKGVAELEVGGNKPKTGSDDGTWFGSGAGTTKTETISFDTSTVRVLKPKKGRFNSKPGMAFLYVGPPGTGKTLGAMGVAGEAGIPIIIIKGSMENTLLGGGSSRVDIVIMIARKLGPCMIFVDEAESAAAQRQKGGERVGANSDGTTTKWLAAIDGPQNKLADASEYLESSDIMLFAMATNYKDAMDEAIMREGRLKTIGFSMPTVPLLQRLLKMYVGKKKIPLGSTIDVEFKGPATLLSGKSPADIAGIANTFAEQGEEALDRLEARLRKAGKLTEEAIQAEIASKKFEQRDFLFAVIEHLMGLKIEDDTPDFRRDANTGAHELAHGLAAHFADKLGLSDDVMRLLCVQRREKTLGVCYRSPRDGSRTKLDGREYLSQIILGYGGAAMQMVLNDDTERFGLALDLYRDTGPGSDYDMCATRLKDAITKFYFSLNIGPISKGIKGQTMASEMGEAMVDKIDIEVNAWQKLGFGLSHKICAVLIRTEVFWEMMDSLVISQDRVMIEHEFYAFTARLEQDPLVVKLLEELPGYIKTQTDKLTNDPAKFTWMPERQQKEVRDFVNAKMARLEPMYNELEARLIAEREAEDAELLAA